MRRAIGPFQALIHPSFGDEGLVHGFVTREGTAGEALSRAGSFDELARAAGNLEIRTLRQVHGTRVLIADDCESGAEADAVVTQRPGLLLGIQTADCVPILLYDPERRAIGAAHAGWRGTAAGIAREAVQTLSDRYGSPARELFAVVGPAIGPCCYEVGPEVAEALERAAPGAGQACGRGARGNPLVDLWRANRLALTQAGIDAGRVFTVDTCTHCHPELFPSYRRDGRTSTRLLSFIGLSGDGANLLT